jgi:sugar/nucleoside kinase (ribokinase family)
VPRLALVGNLSFDLVDGRPPRLGGAPIHCARALRLLGVRATIVARCAAADVRAFRRGFAELGLPVTLVGGEGTTTFSFNYDGDRRTMSVERVGDVWSPGDLPRLARGGWVHAAPLLQGDFPAETLAVLARGRRLSLDGQGLTRVRDAGPLRLEGNRDPAVLQHVSILKLAAEEAEALVGNVNPRVLAELGPPEVVVTFGSRGSVVVADGEATEIRARHVDADPTGSGDAYGIAYLAARASRHPPAAAARLATALVGALLRGRCR